MLEEIESNQRQHHNEIQFQMKLELLETEQQFKIVSMINPKFGLDGNQFYFLYGDNLQEGVAGFGETPMKALLDFNTNWNTSLK